MQVPFFCYYSGFVAEDFRVCLSRGHCEKQIVGIDAKFVPLGLGIVSGITVSQIVRSHAKELDDFFLCLTQYLDSI